MKISIEFDKTQSENEIIIRCHSINEEIQKLQEMISDIAMGTRKFVCYQNETEGGHIRVHTRDQVYLAKQKLYELEEMLPGTFMRVSKSTILNTNHIFSITKNLAASSVVEFTGTHKQVYVSRYYYKPLKFKLEEKRNIL